MTEDDASVRSRARRLGIHWRGHLFLFEKKSEPAYDASAGLRLLLIVFALEGVIGPRLSLLSWLRLPLPPFWLRVPILLGFALLLIRFVGGVPLFQIGFRPWREWSRTEKSYFVQVLLMANVVFSILFAGRFRENLSGPSALGHVCAAVLANFLWGFHQEVMYRGVLQTELVRRWGALR